MAYRNEGGLLFRIKFDNAKDSYMILNTPDRQILGKVALNKEWSVDDYVLVVEENGN